MCGLWIALACTWLKMQAHGTRKDKVHNSHKEEMHSNAHIISMLTTSWLSWQDRQNEGTHGRPVHGKSNRAKRWRSTCVHVVHNFLKAQQDLANCQKHSWWKPKWNGMKRNDMDYLGWCSINPNAHCKWLTHEHIQLVLTQRTDTQAAQAGPTLSQSMCTCASLDPGTIQSP